MIFLNKNKNQNVCVCIYWVNLELLTQKPDRILCFETFWILSHFCIKKNNKMFILNKWRNIVGITAVHSENFEIKTLCFIFYFFQRKRDYGVMLKMKTYNSFSKVNWFLNRNKTWIWIGLEGMKDVSTNQGRQSELFCIC